MLNISFVFVSCPLITRTSDCHVFIYLLLHFSDKKKINHSIRKKKIRQKKIPLRGFGTPLCVLLTTGYTHNMLLNMQIWTDGAIADGGLFILIYRQFLLQRRLSDSIEQYNEPPRYRLHRNFAKSIFVVQIYQTDARITNLTERHWWNDCRETSRYHIRAKVNISMLYCALVMRIFRIEGIYL